MTIQEINDTRFKRLAQCVSDRGGRLYVVGGLPRDTMIRLVHGQTRRARQAGLGDRDLVCFGLDLGQIREAVSPLGPSWIIGHRVLSHRKTKEPALVKVRLGESEFSLSLSRRPGAGESIFDPGACLADDAFCRDFTVNSVYYDPLGESFSDPLGAADDFQARRLELCAPAGLADDPVRILRAMAFVSRLGFTPGPGLLKATMRDWPLLGWVPAERLWPEWRKWTLSAWPRFGLEYLREGGALAFWPDLQALIGSPQFPKFHPEGDAWNHTVLVVQAMGQLDLPVSEGRVFLTMASLLHDIGKPKVTFRRADGRVVTKGHGPAGLSLAQKFLKSVMAPFSVSKPVLRIIERHMDMSFREPTSLNLKILARRLSPFCDLGHFWALARADWNGRSPCPDGFPWTLDEFLVPVGGQRGPGVIPLEARELMAGLGLSGGPTVGRLMEVVTAAFDSGQILTSQEALELAASALADPSFAEARPG
ncbi:MAG: HD domain-containing protein [Deltaproteobacteria bacterium]|jgi:tRNA nucleotidyltransferase/poly(A) polymerase|nr:HD domain-containing protein [Deltaproteobacteria bacterium]